MDYGIDKCIVWRGCGDFPAEFSWCGINTVNLVRGYFNDVFSLNATIEKKAQILKNNLDKISAKSGNVLLLPIGADHLGIESDIDVQIDSVNELLKNEYFIRLGSPFDYFKRVENRFKEFEWNSEIRDNSKTFTLQGCYSSRLDLKKENVECTYLLDLASRFVKIQKENAYNTILEYAYKMLIQNQAHDSICGCSTDDVHSENLTRYKKIKQIANTIIDELKFKNHFEEKKIINLSDKEFSGIVEFKTIQKLEGYDKIDFEKGFETEEYEMLILVQSSCKGAANIEDMLKPSVDFFASIDLRTGQFFHEKGRLEWLIKNDNKRIGWGYEFEQLGIYRITVRKCIPQDQTPYMNNRYMLINVLEENASNEKLKALKAYYAKPITIENELGSFALDREFSWFEGSINWNGVDANVYLETDEEDGDTAKQAMKVLKRVVDNILENDARYREYAAEELTELANDWLEASDEIDSEEITKEIFMKRMEMSEIMVNSDGSLSLLYNDDDMFWGHVIEIDVDSSGKIISAYIAG